MKAQKAIAQTRERAVSKALAVDILDGRWTVGSSLTLDDVQSRFSISRTVAREASKTLESRHAISLRRRVGLVARPVEEWAALDSQVIQWKLASARRRDQLFSLTQLRQAVEPLAAALAADHAPLDTRAKLPLLAEQLRQAVDADDLDRFHALDIDFHALVLTGSGNELFAALADTISTILKGRVELGLYPDRPRPEAIEDHLAVARAIWAGESAPARAAMQSIVEEVASALSNDRGGPDDRNGHDD